MAAPAFWAATVNNNGNKDKHLQNVMVVFSRFLQQALKREVNEAGVHV